MWKIDKTVTLGNSNSGSMALRQVLSKICELAHTDVTVEPRRVVYSLRKARWLMGGQVFDMADGGVFLVDERGNSLSASISIRRTYLNCIFLAVVLSVLSYVTLEVSLFRAVFYGALTFVWLWAVNYFTLQNSLSKFMESIARSA